MHESHAVGVIELAPPHSKLLGCFPTGWYPAGLVLDAKNERLCVPNVKGIGPRNTRRHGNRTKQGKTALGSNPQHTACPGPCSCGAGSG